MTKMLIDRAVVEQVLEVLEQLQGGCTDSDDGTVEAITVWCPEVIEALRSALAQPQIDPVDEYRKGFIEGQIDMRDREQPNPPGCDHCNHPLYAATKCRVCGRVTEQAELVQEPEPGEYHGWVLREVLFDNGEPVGHREPVDVDCCANCLRPKGEHQGDVCPRPYTTVWSAWDYKLPLPQRKPLTEEEILSLFRTAGSPVAFARAIERAHGIGGSNG